MKKRTPHPMFNRLMRIADHLQEHGIGVGDETDDEFIREVAYEVEHLKRLNEIGERTFQTLIKLVDDMQRQLDRFGQDMLNGAVDVGATAGV